MDRLEQRRLKPALPTSGILQKMESGFSTIFAPRLSDASSPQGTTFVNTELANTMLSTIYKQSIKPSRVTV
jgi:hypothetical protein